MCLGLPAWDGLDQHEPEDLGEGLTMNLSMMILEDRKSENDDGVEVIGLTLRDRNYELNKSIF